MSKAGWAGLLIGSYLGLGCGASPQLKSTAAYRPEELTRGPVLFVPLAVSLGEAMLDD